MRSRFFKRLSAEELADILSKTEATSVEERIKEIRRQSSKRILKTAEGLGLLSDTTFIIDIMKNDSNARRKAKELSDASTSILVGTPTVFELYIGAGSSVRSNLEREKILSKFRSLPKQ